MRYYESNGLLLKENPETKIIRVCNKTNKINTEKSIITPDEFSVMDKKQIKQSTFGQLMNKWFHDIKHEWVYENNTYKKLDNFENMLLCD